MYWVKQYRIPLIADTMLVLAKRMYNLRFFCLNVADPLDIDGNYPPDSLHLIRPVIDAVRLEIIDSG